MYSKPTQEEVKRGRPKKEVKKPIERVYAQQVEIDHDLFKLEVAPLEKNISWNDVPDWVKIEHCHFYHTFDSSGKAQVTCNQVAGHFHEIEVERNENGEIVDYKCVSGPMKYVFVKDKRTGRRVKKAVPYNELDDHRHDMTYLKSDKIQMRKLNSEAVNLIGKNSGLTSKPSGLDIA